MFLNFVFQNNKSKSESKNVVQKIDSEFESKIFILQS